MTPTASQTMHRDPSELLSAYLDGELAPAERERVEAMLRDDPELAWQLTQMRRISAALRRLPAVQMSPAAMAQLREHLIKAPDPVVLRIARWSMAAAAMVLLACSASLWLAGRADADGEQAAPWDAVMLSANLDESSSDPPPDASDAPDAPDALPQWIVQELSTPDPGR